ARAVLDWALDHEDDPIFLERSPSDVALYLLARESALATAVRAGSLARGHLDYTPELDPTRYTPEQLATELLVGFIPGVGEVVFALEVTTGVSLTGHQLEEEDRVFLALCAVLPFVPKFLARSGEGLAAVERTALLTGHGLHEATVLSRLASHLSPADVEELERLIRAVSGGRHLTAEEVARLNGIARRMEAPLAKLGELIRKGGKAPLVGSRLSAGGAPLVIGSAEHMAQCWIEYQFRYPGRSKRFSYAVDPGWERLYRSIVENSAAGGEFEKAILEAARYERNTVPMMPPPGEGMKGFIADAVKGNPRELVWGQPYHFVEAKGRQQMALTGNLQAMLAYVTKYGGHLEVWFRSGKHPRGATKLTEPLKTRLDQLENAGKVKTEFFP
ncbi:MAG TPA: hypothetical protein VK447_05565, partial [Myxococcaceae bacterium]|nr:hypothetical protein [Myxococcaceae bacterium]